jgi:protocatechuate 3,4-dioxygenase beta subunit
VWHPVTFGNYEEVNLRVRKLTTGKLKLTVEEAGFADSVEGEAVPKVDTTWESVPSEYNGVVASIISLGGESLSDLPLLIEHTLTNTADKPVVIYDLENAIIPEFEGNRGGFGTGASGEKASITLDPGQSVSRCVWLSRVKPGKERPFKVNVRGEGTGFNQMFAWKFESSTLKFRVGYHGSIFIGKRGREFTQPLATPWIEIEVENDGVEPGELSGTLKVIVHSVSTGKSLAGAAVSFTNRKTSESFKIVTDEKGVALIDVVPGDYAMTNVSKEGYRSHKRDVQMESKAGKVEYIDIELGDAPRVTGYVRDGNGKGVKGASVVMVPWGPRGMVTDSEGKFEFSWDPRSIQLFLVARVEEKNLAGSVQFHHRTGEPAYKEGEKVEITIGEGLTLVGQVTEVNGEGIGGADVAAEIFSGGMWPAHVVESTTDTQGNYEINAIPIGHEYWVDVSRKGYGPRHIEVEGERVSANVEKVQTVVLKKANLSVSGVVLDANGMTVEGAEVRCWGQGQPKRQVRTDVNGRFTVAKVCEGKLRIQARKNRLSGVIDTQGGESNVRIVLSKARGVSTRRRRKEKEPGSLLGKSLSELEAIGIKFDAVKSQGKRILVCFWDMNQRPSRHMIRELTKRAEQLKEKGFAILCVQVSKVDKDKFEEWVKENKIAFAVAMVEVDEEKLRNELGVKSLPWLILSDTNLTVEAEGIGIEELDKRSGIAEEKPSVWLTVLATSPIRSLDEYMHWIRTTPAPAAPLYKPVPVPACDFEIRRVSDQQRVARIPLREAFGGESELTRSARRRIGRLGDGEYLVALSIGDMCCSNVSRLIVDSDYDASGGPTLSLVALEAASGGKLPFLGIRAVGPTPPDAKLTNQSIAFPTLIVDGVERNLTKILWTGPVAPLKSGKVYTRILSLGRYEPAIEPGKKHTVKAIVGKYESASVVIPADNMLSQQWDKATKNLPPVAPPMIVLEGKVIGLDGKAADGYRVSLSNNSGSVFKESTKKDGAYQFVNIPAGSYNLTCHLKGRGQPDLEIENVQISQVKKLTIDISMHRKYILSGTVSHENDGAAANIGVWYTCEDRKNHASFNDYIATDAKGRYEVGGPFTDVTYVGVKGKRIKGTMPRFKSRHKTFDLVLKDNGETEPTEAEKRRSRRDRPYNFRDSWAYEQLSESDRGKLETVHRDLILLYGALDLYAAHNSGSVPEKLEGLVPLYLSELPTDPFAKGGTAVSDEWSKFYVPSKKGRGYGYKAGARGSTAWVVASVGLPKFPYRARRGKGLYLAKGAWSGGEQHVFAWAGQAEPKPFYNFRKSQAYRELSESDKQKLEKVHEDFMLLRGALDIYALSTRRKYRPDTLDELVPRILLELPKDPFATEQTAAETNIPPGYTPSRQGWGYRYLPGAVDKQSWSVASVGLAGFAYRRADGNRGLSMVK